jgi:hypothetical protein
MRLWLPNEIHAVAIDADLVFLDTVSETYICVTNAATVLALQDDGAVVTEMPEAAEPLIDAGLLTRDPTTAKAAPPVRPRVGLPTMTRTVSPRALIQAVRANKRAALAFDALGFRQLLDLAQPPIGTDAPEERRLAASLSESARFARMAPWLPKDGACVMRSLQQLFYLRAFGHRPQWVFGVRTWPFEAHCWLQVGDVVLDDQVEHVQAFTPILAV